MDDIEDRYTPDPFINYQDHHKFTRDHAIMNFLYYTDFDRTMELFIRT